MREYYYVIYISKISLSFFRKNLSLSRPVNNAGNCFPNLSPSRVQNTDRPECNDLQLFHPTSGSDRCLLGHSDAVQRGRGDWLREAQGQRCQMGEGAAQRWVMVGSLWSHRISPRGGSRTQQTFGRNSMSSSRTSSYDLPHIKHCYSCFIPNPNYIGRCRWWICNESFINFYYNTWLSTCQ